METLVVGNERPERSRRVRALRVRTVLVLVLVVFGLLYLTAVSRTGGRFPRTAAVGGVAVGGLDQAGAEDRLVEQLGPVLDRPLQVRIEADIEPVTTRSAGLSVDYAESARVPVRGNRYDPRQLWWALHGSYSRDLAVLVDEDRLAARVALLGRDYDHPPVNAALEYEGPRGVATSGDQDGVTVDRTRTAQALRTAYLDPDRSLITVPLRFTPARVTLTDAQEASDRYAFAATSADILVQMRGGGRLHLDPTLISTSLTFRPRGHTLVPQLDGERLLRGARTEGAVTVSAQRLALAVLPVLTKTSRDRVVTL